MKVNLELSSDEALVLFEFLSRFVDKEQLEISDQSEKRVLWDLQATLEKKLVEPFRADYNDILEKAQSRLRNPK